ncbi:MAG TPA: hypothetical protein VN649_17030 [Ramlibacter sp.]|nr:hypothetical protein [Ramlibacter sp.]
MTSKHDPLQDSPEPTGGSSGNARSGEGADSALSAMLKKRREGESGESETPDGEGDQAATSG